MSAATSQPTTRRERIESIQATLACPTFSIHMRHRDPAELRAALDGLPTPVPRAPGVFHCGFHSEKSFGATSYLIARTPEDGGNIMMDCPRWSARLAKNIDALGGVRTIVLSHIDDISDHDKWAAHFGAPRVMHETELRGSIRDVEVQLAGSGPWDLQGNTVAEGHLDGGVVVVHTPGHTAGSVTLWHAASRTVFTGDHLGYSHRVGRPSIFPRYNRAGYERQVDSVRKLLQFDFENVLPGHGRRFSVSGEEGRERMVQALAHAELGAALAA